VEIKKLIFVVFVSFSVVACVSTKTYVDPNFSGATYDDVNSVDEKYNARILIEFQRNGKLFERANKEVRGHVERTLRATGIIVPTTEDSPISLKVTVNNVADIGEAAAKGFGTGLTFGAAGSLVTDYYEIQIEYSHNTCRCFWYGCRRNVT